MEIADQRKKQYKDFDEVAVGNVVKLKDGSIFLKVVPIPVNEDDEYYNVVDLIGHQVLALEDNDTVEVLNTKLIIID